jgi:uncharacterized membrane protein YGL010W
MIKRESNTIILFNEDAILLAFTDFNYLLSKYLNMRNLNQMLSEYAESHQNNQNIMIHMICVPAIFISIIGLLYCVPLFHAGTSLITLADVTSIAIIVYYLRLSLKHGAVLSILIMFFLRVWRFVAEQDLPVFNVAISIFVVAWIGQFIGHKIEGKKPSFFKDLQFLLIGPMWTLSHIIKP